MSFKRTRPAPVMIGGMTLQAPHCDQRVLHAPGECKFCDGHPEWQELRFMWGIAFTGYEPETDKKEMPCPADHARPGGKCEVWGGNKAKP